MDIWKIENNMYQVRVIYIPLGNSSTNIHNISLIPGPFCSFLYQHKNA